MFRLFDLIARHWPMPGPRRGVVVIRMDGIGDMVLFRRILDDYAEVLGVPSDDITVIGCASWGPIVDTAFGDYRRLIIDEHAFARQPFYRLKIALMVRRLKPAITLCDTYFRRALMSDSLAWFTGAPTTIVSLPYINEPTRAEFTYYLSQVDAVIDTGTYPTHEIVRHYRFLAALGGRNLTMNPPRIPWRDVVPALAAEGPYVVLNPGSNEYGRRWPFASYLEAAERALARGLRVVWVGGADEQAGDPSQQFGNDPRVIDLMGKTNLPELLDLLKHAALVLTNDTGPAHLAIALGAPTVVVVGGGHFGSFVPYPEEVRPANARFAYHEMACYHCFWRCHLRTSRFDVFPCVSAVSVDAVWREAEELLASAKVPA